MYVCRLPSVLGRCRLDSRKGIWPVKSWVVAYWRGYLSGARCRLAYGPADATATQSLAPVKSRLVLPFWYRLTWVLPEKGPLNGCVCVYVRRMLLLTTIITEENENINKNEMKQQQQYKHIIYCNCFFPFIRPLSTYTAEPIQFDPTQPVLLQLAYISPHDTSIIPLPSTK